MTSEPDADPGRPPRSVVVGLSLITALMLAGTLAAIAAGGASKLPLLALPAVFGLATALLAGRRRGP